MWKNSCKYSKWLNNYSRVYIWLVIHDLFISVNLESYCPCPPAPTNGSRNCSGSNEVAAYSHLCYKCDSGYHVAGDEYRTCHPSGNWTGTTPVCVKGDKNNIRSLILYYGATHKGEIKLLYLYIFLINLKSNRKLCIRQACSSICDITFPNPGGTVLNTSLVWN